jgi:RNA polymerase sigma factor (sigma-70 family)
MRAEKEVLPMKADPDYIRISTAFARFDVNADSLGIESNFVPKLPQVDRIVAPDEAKKISRARLMERGRDGDRAAFVDLFRGIGPLITGFLRRRVRDGAEIEDICQEVLLAVYRSRHTYQSGRPLEPWLFAIVRKVSSEHLRRTRQRFAWQVETDEMPEPAAEENPSLAVEFREALEQLSPSQREALALTKLRGLSLAQAARHTGAAVGSMKLRVHRAYASLKRSLID